MSVSTEDFLKSVYQLKFDYGKKASSSNLADSLGISNAAVTDMAKKLSDRDLVIYRKYKEISLTAKGKLAALKVIRKHRLWESFLTKTLNLSPNEVHQEAEVLEHQTSDSLLEKIDEYLGHPDFNPHGDPIPDITGNFPASDSIQLIEGKKGKQYTISRIQYRDRNYQNFLNTNNIRIGSRVIIQDIFEEDQSVSVDINQKQIIFNSGIARCIHITTKAS